MSENNTRDKKQKILLVEDEENIAFLFKYNFNKAGYNCETASNGREGFEKAKEFLPDLIISDIMMPEVDGFEFRKLLMSDPLVAPIPFVYFTAKGADDDILQGYDLDIEDYILKTSSPKIVVAKVAALLKSKAKEREKAVQEVHSAADNMGAKVVPDEMLKVNGFTVNHWHQTFENIPGGDFIDYVPIDDDTGVIVLGDVMGKKWKAWYFAVAYAGYVRSAVRFALSSDNKIQPSTILEKVNNSVFHDERIADVFITLSILVINNKSKIISYAGAGDLPLIVKGKETKFISSRGLLLGFSEKPEYEDYIIETKPGDELFLFTDGIIESRNPAGEMYGKDRLIEMINNLPASNNSLEQIKSKFSDFTKNKFEDDVTLISVKTE